MHESYRNAMQIHNEGVEEGGSNMENKGSSYDLLSVEGGDDKDLCIGLTLSHEVS